MANDKTDTQYSNTRALSVRGVKFKNINDYLVTKK